MVTGPPAQKLESFPCNKQAAYQSGCLPFLLLWQIKHASSDTTISCVFICHAQHEISGNTMSYSFYKVFCSFVLITEQRVKIKDCWKKLFSNSFYLNAENVHSVNWEVISTYSFHFLHESKENNFTVLVILFWLDA